MQNKECTHGSINISHSSNWCQLCALTVILSNPFHMYYLCTPAFTVSLISFEYLEPQFAGRQNSRIKRPCTHSFAMLLFCIVKIKHSCRFQCLESTSSIKTFFPPSCPPSWCLSVFVFLGRLTEAHRTAVKVIRRMQYFVARRKFQVRSRINHKCISLAWATLKVLSELTCLGECGCNKSKVLLMFLGSHLLWIF